MRVISILTEALRDTASGTSRAVQWCLTLAICLAALSLADGLQVAAIEHQVTRFRSAGADILVTQTEGLVDGRACDRLTEVASIQFAGAVAKRDYLTMPAAPDTPIQTYAVTTGLGAVLGIADTQEPGVWMTTEQAAALGLNVGESIQTESGDLRLAGVFEWPSDGRDARFRYAALVPTQSQSHPFDECWARSWPQHDDVKALLLSTIDVTSSSEPVQAAQVNATLGRRLDAVSLLDSRLTAVSVYACMLVGLAIGAVSSRTRRLEFASSLHVGQTRLGLGLTVAIEALIWTLLAMLIAGDCLWLVLRLHESIDFFPTLLIAGRGIICGGVASFLGAVLGTFFARERHLFRYFKER
ncbi:MAG: hypothetical protein LBV00_11475 [Propionibacteriaceae bacterium]|jgi:hypothetical protein|nr:hypothetical protein [Propionibacteriaceae bacterium]